MTMRRFLFRVVLAITLALTVVPTAAADTGDPEPGDLGLDGVTITRIMALKSGAARATGTIQCSQDLELAEVYLSIRQDVGRFHTVIAYGWGDVSCSADLGTASFSVILEPEEGRIRPNRAQIEADAVTVQCSWDDEVEDEVCTWDTAGIEPTLMKVRRGR